MRRCFILLGMLVAVVWPVIVFLPGPASGFAIGFGFEPPVYQVGQLAGQDSWTDHDTAGFVESSIKLYGQNALSLKDSPNGTGEVDRPIGQSLTGPLYAQYNLFLPSDWMRSQDIGSPCDAHAAGAWMDLSLNNGDKIDFGFASVKTLTLSPLIGLNGNVLFLEGNHNGIHYYQTYVVSLANFLNTWHDFQLVLGTDGKAVLVVDGSQTLKIDLGVGIQSIDAVSFDHWNLDPCDCLSRWAYFDSPGVPVAEPGTFVLLVMGLAAVSGAPRIRGRS